MPSSELAVAMLSVMPVNETSLVTSPCETRIPPRRLFFSDIAVYGDLRQHGVQGVGASGNQNAVKPPFVIRTRYGLQTTATPVPETTVIQDAELMLILRWQRTHPPWKVDFSPPGYLKRHPTNPLTERPRAARSAGAMTPNAANVPMSLIDR
jgi:hypothetical protein